MLRDGRILILARLSRRGMNLMSADQAQPDRPISYSATISVSTTTRSATATDYSDIGYPLATELDDGRVFAPTITGE